MKYVIFVITWLMALNCFGCANFIVDANKQGNISAQNGGESAILVADREMITKKIAMDDKPKEVKEQTKSKDIGPAMEIMVKYINAVANKDAKGVAECYGDKLSDKNRQKIIDSFNELFNGSKSIVYMSVSYDERRTQGHVKNMKLLEKDYPTGIDWKNENMIVIYCDFDVDLKDGQESAAGYFDRLYKSYKYVFLRDSESDNWYLRY